MRLFVPRCALLLLSALLLIGCAAESTVPYATAEMGVDALVPTDAGPRSDSVLPATDALVADVDTGAPTETRIMPYAQNASYWQYKGQPLLLLGGAIHSNLFQVDGLTAHLDEIKAAGGNVVRNTMSQRTSWNLPGDLQVPYKKLSDGRYDLEQWNDAYWTMFEQMLRWCHEREIIVQLELWDYWDFAGSSWETNAFRPLNTVTYTTTTSGLNDTADKSAWKDLQPFFHSVPALDNNTLVLSHQQAFVRKVLSYTLQYDNVLYTMDNETAVPPAWGAYWSKFIKLEALAAGVTVETSEMWNDSDIQNSDAQKESLDNPQLYSFLDISQNNVNFDQEHWDQLQWVRGYIAGSERPINNTKIYSDGNTSWGSGDPQQGVERFWRNLIGGAATSRFHRPPVAGIGLNDVAKKCIAAARKLETLIKLWEIEPRMDLLSSRESDEAYLAAKVGEYYALYFTQGGSVALTIGASANDTFDLHWINIDSGEWGAKKTLVGGGVESISAPGLGAWVAAIIKR